MHVYVSGRHMGAAVPDSRDQLLAGECLAWIGGEKPQQIELRGRQVERRPVQLGSPGVIVYLKPLRLQRPARFVVGTPSKVGLDPGQQFSRTERLGDVVIAADFEPEHPVDLLGASRQEEDRSVGSGRVRAQAATEFETVAVRQHHVEDDQVRTVILNQLVDSIESVSGHDVVPAVAQVVFQECAKILVIFDYDNRLSHAFPRTL